MARGFNLTAQLNLRGPNNVGPILTRLRRQLGSVNVTVNPVVDPAAARNVAALQNSLNNLNRVLGQTNTLANNTARAITNLSNAAAGVGANLRNLPNNINAATTALNRAGTTARTTQTNIQQAATGFEEFGRQSALAVRRFAAFATVTGVIYKFTSALSSATTQFIDFNQELVRVSQVTDTSLKDLGPLVSQITSLSTGLGVASKDLITVSSTLAQAGLSARDTEKALKALALSALAPSFDSLNDTVEGSIALMRQFGISAGDLEGALGSVNAVAAAFAVESSDLITAIQRTGGVFAAASKGVSEGKDALNEFLAIFTSIRQTTRESAETIATGLRTIFTRIQRGKTIDALKEYGVVLTDLSGKFVGPYEAVRRLSEGLSKLDPRDLKFSAIVEELGGFRQIGKVIPLIQQFTVAQQALKVAQEGQGSLATDAATAQLALANKLTKVREEFNALIRSVGESSSFQTFVQLSLDLASALIKLADSAKTVLPALTAIAAFRGAAALGSFARGFTGRLTPPQVATPNAGGYIRRFATGGIVPGYGTGDSVPAMLTPGEFVMNRKAVQKYGQGNLVRMNKAGAATTSMTTPKKRGFFFDFDDTLAVSGAKERPGEEDPYVEFRGSKGRSFLETASATKYASMAQRRASEGYDVWVLTARPGDKDTVGGIRSFGAQTGIAFKGIIGVAGLSQRKGVDTASAKSMILSRYSKMYPDGIVFYDDASENVIQASQVPGVKARLAKKYYGGNVTDSLVYKFAKAGPATEKQAQVQQQRKRGRPSGGPKGDILEVPPGLVDLLFLKVGKNPPKSQTPLLSLSENYPGDKALMDKYKGAGALRFSYGANLLDPEASTAFTNNLIPAIESSITNLASTVGSIKNLSPTPLPPVNQGIVADNVRSRLDSEVVDAISGYFFEGIINSLTGAPLTEAQATWDFLSPAGDVKDKLDTLFGPGESKANISGKFLEAKATYDANIITDATKSNSIRNKIVTSLNKGEMTPSIIKNPTPQTKRMGGKIKRFATGGLVPGVGNTDSVPMQLPVGSFVIRKSSVNKIGADNLAGMAGYATGGNVKTVDALVTPGEWIFSPDQASKIGSGTLNSMNKFGKFAMGGRVGFQTGGPARGELVPNFAPVTQAAERAIDNLLAKIVDRIAKADPSVEFDTAYRQAEDTMVGPASAGLMRAADTGDEKAALAVAEAQRKQVNSITAQIRAADSSISITDARAAAERKVADAWGGLYRKVGQTQPGLMGKAQGFTATAQTYQQRAQAAGPSVMGDIYSGLAKFNQALAMGTTGLSRVTTAATSFGTQLRGNFFGTLTKAATSAASSLYGLGKSALGAVGGVVGGGIGRVGGGILGMLGLGRGRGAAAAGTAATGRGMGGMGGGMMAMMLPMVGGMVVDSVSKSMGGETTDIGRKVGSMGGQALNYGSMGAMVGSMVAPLLGPLAPLGPALGGLLGGVAGLTMGFFEAEKAGQEYAQSQRQAASDVAMEQSGKAVEKYAASGSALDRKNAIAALTESSAKEAAVGAGLQREKAGYFTSGEDITAFAERRAKTQKGGADQAEKILSTSMMKSGKTFDELSKTMNPTEFKMLASNIAEADKNYAYFQTQRANEIARLKSEGKNAEAAALEASTAAESENMAKNIAARAMKEHDAAIAAQKAAAASKALAMTVERAILNLERTFDIMNQTMQRASFEFEEAGSRIQEITSGQVSLASGQELNRQINVLENPEAYSAAEKNKAIASSAAMLGSQGAMVARVSQFGPQARNEAMRIGNEKMAAGADKEDIGRDIKNTLRRQIESAYGSDTDLGRVAIENMIKSVDKSIEEAGAEPLDINSIVDAAVGPLMKASEQASKMLIEANKTTIAALKHLGETSQAIADLQQKQADRTNALRDMQRESSLKTRESLGIKVTGQERIRSRMAGTAQRLGFARPEDVNSTNIAAARQATIAQQGRLMAQKPAMEQAAATGDKVAAQNLVMFNTRLAQVNQTVKDLDKELADLPQLLESNLNDVLSEMQDRVNDLEQRKEAGAAFAEKLVGSTPQEMMELNRTFALLQNTLRGNLVTIERSDVAQMAYVSALQQGKSVQEAVSDAQTAYANQNKAALSLFNELTQMSGVKGPAFDQMRADLMENMARAQGMGLENNPMFRKVIDELRKTPEQRAQDDPMLAALMNQAEGIKRAQVEAVRDQNRIDRDAQKALLDNASQGIIDKLKLLKFQLQANVNAGAMVVNAQLLRSGGTVYAANGQLINYEPKGTDTVPAMLTPGEFVVNKKATQKNLGLLQTINSGHMSKGGVVYLAEGGENKKDMSGFSSRSTLAFDRENTLKQNSMLKLLDSDLNNVKYTTNNIDRDTGTIKNNSIPSLSEQGSEGMLSAANGFSSLGKAIAQLSKELSPAKKPLSDFYSKFDTFSGRSSATLASISDNSDFIAAAAIKISDDIADVINNLMAGAGAQGIGQMLGNMFGVNNPGRIIQDFLDNMMGNIGDMLGFSNGGIVYANNGMLIPYQPKGTDTVPAMLTPGEFVVNRSATQQNLPLLKAINNGTANYAKGGPVYLARGGFTNGEKALLSGIAQANIRRYSEGLTPDTWVLASKEIIGRKERPITFLDENLNPMIFGKGQRGFSGEFVESPVFPWKSAAKVLAPNSQLAAESMTNLVGDRWKDVGKLIGANQLINAANLVFRQATPADRVIEEVYNQSGMTKITQFGGSPPNGLQPRNTLEQQNLVDPFKRAQDLADKVKADPDKYPDLAMSISKRLSALKGAVNNINNGISILNKSDANLWNKNFKSPQLDGNTPEDWLLSQLAYSNAETKHLKEVWKELTNILPGPGLGGFLGTFDLNNFYPATEAYRPFKYNKGGIVYAKNGMMIPYQSKGTDTIPAMLTPGEFVVNRQSTQNNLPLLQAINSGQYSNGGKVAYLAQGTQGVEALNKQMMLLTEILRISADNLQTSFNTIITNLQNIKFNNPEKLLQNNGGVSSIGGSNSLAAIQALGNKLDQFILQLQASIPPSITLEVSQPIPVNVNINGAAALQNLLNGPLANMITNLITQAFNAESRKKEGQ